MRICNDNGAKFSCDRFRHALLRDLRKMDVQQLYLHLGSNDILTNEAVFYRDVADLCDLVHQEAHNRCPECRVVCSNEDALLSHFCSRHIKQPETGKESKIKLIGSPMIASANHELNEVSSRKWKACLENRSFHYEGTYKHFPPTMWIKMFGLMILGRMCGQGGLHYIMMQLCIQQHVNLSQRMLMLLNLLNDVEKNPGPEYSCKWISCKEDFHSIGQQDAHIISHVVQEKCCRWLDCTNVLSFNSLENHELKHLYDVSLALCMNWCCFIFCISLSQSSLVLMVKYILSASFFPPILPFIVCLHQEF
ncbi:uncharacterized protein LOC127853266 isoform X3 [Dreissena polymorpha]|uniref:uncharacterized protein LOC127853266 isoform X3 n=1 Tax=Dreissena polymorpha TaxID=45954 RepID=UPI0022648836|nr:uncharacterized protein LOC127853266 isoform X3 [Dreissena polymorpha]